ncbi:MAG: hypothetical protein JO270_00565, partial [Acidobacteriaceae bacterium]|nr:hypothetical protein [Acidobacteriaceae bacterium]
MRTNHRTFAPHRAWKITGILLIGAALAFGQQQVNLSAGPGSIALPDGNGVPMWGYSCGAVVSGSTATCAALGKGAWSPVVITVPSGADLQINLTNNLKFANGNAVPTSIMIVGQVGGGLGTVGSGCTGGATCTPSPTHGQQQTTWTIANAQNSSGQPYVNNPPPQGPRVQSFSTEVAAGATTPLVWKAPRPGTYLLESGTHPSIQVPMGLIGMLVVTQAATAGSAGPPAVPATQGTAYPNVNYDAEVPLLFSEIDPVQNNAVQTAVNTAGFSETKVWS